MRELEMVDGMELHAETLSSGTVVDVLYDLGAEGRPHCSGRHCRQILAQTALPGFEEEERWVCGLSGQAPPVPPHDYCEPRALDLAEILSRNELLRSGAALRGGEP